ncbi:MAG: tRNA (guanosine(18)-2'-O)-methyltransferase TrmH [Gemmatimonadota bacterium]
MDSPPTPIRPRRFRRIQEVLNRRQPDLTVVMDRVHKPHNLSAVARSCDAVGVGTIHAVPLAGKVDLHNATSAGAAGWVEVREHPDLTVAMRDLAREGFQLVVAHLDPQAVDFRSVDYTQPTAMVVGSELVGVDSEALKGEYKTVVLPMMGMVQSLNVSVATAVLLYEAQRQREAAGMYAQCRLDPDTLRELTFRWAYPRLAASLRRAGSPYPPLDAQGSIEG